MLPYLAVAAICIIWGTTYLAIRVGVKEFPPFLFSGIRFIIAGAIICIYYFARGYKWPTGKIFRKLLWSGIFIMIGGNLLLVISEKHIPSGLAALINAGFPFWIIIITSIIHPSENVKANVLIGLTIGLVGQITIFYDQLAFLTDPAYLTSIIILLMSAWSGAYGSVFMKKHTVHLHPVFSGGIQMLCSGFISTSAGFLIGERIPFNASSQAWMSLFYLIIAGSIIGYSCFCYALSKLPAAKVSVYTYINPIVALWLGWLVLNEQISALMLVAMVITIIGVYIVTRRSEVTKITE
jgi:drug/metabolite transporter (DMT)-like permease